MKKAIFFDIDGTLIDVTKGQTRINEKVRNALKSVQSAGHYIFLATGRPLSYLDSELVNFGFDGFVLTNGAVVVIHDEVIFSEPINKNLIKEICSICESNNIEYILQGYPKVYLRNGYKLMEDFYSSIDINVDDFVRNFDVNDIDVYKMEFLTERKDVNEIYQHWLHDTELTGITDPFHYNNLELYARKNTKASGIIHAINHLGIDIKNSYAFGDGLNDIEMIKTVGCGIAMGNGNPKLKELAKYVVPSIHDDGVAYGINKYILEVAPE